MLSLPPHLLFVLIERKQQCRVDAQTFRDVQHQGERERLVVVPVLDPAQGTLVDIRLLRKLLLLHPDDRPIIRDFSANLLEEDRTLELHLVHPHRQNTN